MAKPYKRLNKKGQPCAICGAPFEGGHCKVCLKEKNKGRERSDPEKVKQWLTDNPDKVRNLGYKKRFGISLEEYNQMFADQQGCCAICGKHQSEFKRRFAVDHNHETGKIRGLLCLSCNTHLGIYELQKDIFETYLLGE
jgi:hypothetical protein